MGHSAAITNTSKPHIAGPNSMAPPVGPLKLVLNRSINIHPVSPLRPMTRLKIDLPRQFSGAVEHGAFGET